MTAMSERTADSVLNDAAQTLETAQWGLADFAGPDPRRRMSGLRNLVVFGRAVTNVLQNLRSVVGKSEFDKWYIPWQDEMRADDLLRYFYELRSEILKEGSLETGTSVHISSLDGRDMQILMQNRPPGVKSFFIGDRLNGNGWLVQLPDGSDAKYYVAIPPDIQSRITSRFHFADAPHTHGGEALEDTSVENLARLYIEYLQSLLADARKRFSA
jgi:hypothetical protein